MCSEQIDGSIRSFLLRMTLMLLSYLTAVIGPLYELIFHGTKTTILDLKIPFTAESSYTEYLVNFVLQAIVSYHGIFGYIGLEVSVQFFKDVVTISPKIIQYELKQLDNMRKNKCSNDTQQHLIFMNIIKQSIDYEKYIILYHFDLIFIELPGCGWNLRSHW